MDRTLVGRTLMGRALTDGTLVGRALVVAEEACR